MNRQNENNVTKNDDRELFSYSSDIKNSENEEKPESGAKKVAAAEDIDDYVFLSSHRKKKKKKSGYQVHEDDTFAGIYTHGSRSKKHRKHHKKYNGRHKMKLWKKIVIGVVSTLLALVILITGTVVYLIHRGSSELFNPDISISAPDGISVQEDGKYVVYNGDTYKFNDKVTNILCIGVDKRDIEQISEIHGTGGQADVLIMVSIDTSTGKITLVNISRDTMTDVTIYSAGGAFVGTTRQQLCLAYAYGDGKELSCENTVNSAKRLFYNMPVNTYFAMDLDGIAAINDSIGGVDIVSPETVGTFVEGESYHLLGKSAEYFVQTRNKDILDSNNLRMQRQQVYLKEFIDKVINLTKEDMSTPLDLFNASAPYTCTNLNPSKVMYLAQSAVQNGNMAIDMVSVPGTVTKGGQYAEFNINEKEFYEMFLNIYYTKM